MYVQSSDILFTSSFIGDIYNILKRCKFVKWRRMRCMYINGMLTSEYTFVKWRRMQCRYINGMSTSEARVVPEGNHNMLV